MLKIKWGNTITKEEVLIGLEKKTLWKNLKKRTAR